MKKRRVTDKSGRKLAAIMFTDMVGFTALNQSNEEQALEILEKHNRLLRPFFPKYHGREVKTIGDSFLVEFVSALDATLCAIEIQKFLHDYNVSARDDWKIKLRIGIHLGDVVHKVKDILGDAVNIASRIESLADPESVCVSQQVFDQIHNKIDYPLEKLERSELKNVKFETRVYAVVMPWEDSATRLRRVAYPDVEMDRLRIAVLPFSSMSPDPNDEYFTDGMTEELISKISLISELSVISRTSVMGYKNLKNKRVIDIGSELKVGTLLEGSVRKAGSRVRISVQLIEVETDRHLWSANYDRTLEDVFQIQSEIADNVARELKIRLLETENARIKKSSTENVEAHILYLKGLAAYSKSTKEGLEKSIEYYREAIERDPVYATAYAATADSFIRIGFKELQPSKEAFRKAKTFAEKALEIDPNLADAHLSFGSVIRNLDWDYEGAEKEFRKVIELNPNLAEAHSRLAVLLAQESNFEEAIQEVRRALELDPMSADKSAVAGMLYLYSRRYDESIALLTNATELDPNLTGAYHNLGLALVQKGSIAEGIKYIEKAVKTEPGAESKMELAYAYTRAGNMEEARKILSELIEGYKENPGLAAAIAGVYASVGEKDKAIAWLEKAYEEHSGFLKAHLGVDFVFDPLRSDPRFILLLKKIGLE